MRRAVILFPSGLTLGNLFFGVFAIIAASRLQFTSAGVYVLLGGICDALDGRVARATNAGTEFGEELDSLVDAITFGLAPGMIMYFAVLSRDGWDWVWVFLFSACAVMRLARFNIEQAGTAKTYFQGLPSPAAGITLASFYWFSQSPLYTYGAIGDLPWHGLLRLLMAGLAGLMISNVPYPTFPRTGFRTIRELGATLLVLGAIVLLASRRLEYFFPIALIYVAWGLIRWVFGGLFERRQPTLPYDLSEGEDEDEEEEEFDLTDSLVHATRQGHREQRLPRVPERPRGRPERDEAPRERERPARGPERAERAEKPSRPERAADTERVTRRDKKERAKRPDRPERADRAQRPAAASTPAPTPAAPAAPSGGGVAAIDLGAPAAVEPTLPVEDEESAAVAGESDAMSGTEAAPTRKRKRRRRRGDRKERGGATNAASDTSSVSAPVDQSPYAPTAVLPLPPAFTPPAAPAPTPEPAPLIPPALNSSTEPSE